MVKGVNFINLQDAGDPIKNAKFYQDEGADELVFLDITASVEKRSTTVDLVKKISQVVFMPFTVGGGVNSVADIRKLLLAGAEKVSLNTAAVRNPQLLKEASDIFGSQCIVVAIDAKLKGKKWEVYINGGRTPTGLDALKWAKKVQKLGKARSEQDLRKQFREQGYLVFSITKTNKDKITKNDANNSEISKYVKSLVILLLVCGSYLLIKLIDKPFPN